MIPIIYNRGLTKEVKMNIENRKYTVEEVSSIYKEISISSSNRNTGFKRVIAILIVLSIFFILVPMLSSPSNATIFILMICIVLIVFAMLYVQLNIVNKTKKQFIKAVEKGYPELLDQFTSSK